MACCREDACKVCVFTIQWRVICELRLAFLSECCCDYCVAGWLDSAGRLLDGVCADICSFCRRVCQVLDLSPYHNRLMYP